MSDPVEEYKAFIDALLGWTCLAARSAGADGVAVPCLISPRNVPLRIALAGAGFRAEEQNRADGTTRTAVYRRRLDEPLPDLPDWVTVPP